MNRKKEKDPQTKQLNKEIGQRIRIIRKTLGYTQKKMVTFFPVKRASCSRIETGGVFPNPAILKTLRDEFNVSMEWLLFNTGKMFVKDIVKKKKDERVDFGEYTGEVKELLVFMRDVPMVKHAILGFFQEYKIKYNESIEKVLEKTGHTQNKEISVNGKP